MLNTNDNQGGPVPEVGLNLISRLAGDGEPVVSFEPLGSFSNDTSLVVLRFASGTTERLVLRRQSSTGETAERRIRAEFGTLQLLQSTPVPVPTPRFMDPTGEVLGRPGIVTSYVQGNQILDPKDLHSWAQQLAFTLAQIHSIRYEPSTMDFLFDGDYIGTWFLRNNEDAARVAVQPGGAPVLQQVEKLYDSLVPDLPSLIHLDYWPGNVLWLGRRISAIVDWEEASFGDPALDVAYMRMDMSLRGLHRVADEFLAAYEAEAGRPLRNLGFWELAAAVRAMPNASEWTISRKAFGQQANVPMSVAANLQLFLSQARERASSAE
jgi:aminoglycoside phosphotransferase (APT) family kinase protein